MVASFVSRHLRLPEECGLRGLPASKFARAVVAATLIFSVFAGLLAFGLPGHDKIAKNAAVEAAPDVVSSPATPSAAPKNGRFHLLIPATSTNVEFCKLLVSTQILDYPTPVLINFGDPEAADAYVQHLAKVQGFLDYLDNLPPQNSSADGEDLVLIVDGYDVWFQLRRDVLLKRYYALNAAADARNRKVYGDEVFERQDMRQTVIFGPDKICWPIDFSRPACWAVPETTLADDAFGPQTAQGREELNQPRWLNSGTIMGPVSDLKDVFRATLEEIHANHVTDSDQFYMSEVFGRQEYARLENKPELLAYYKDIRYGDERNMEGSPTRSTPRIVTEGPDDLVGRTEYHIGIDHESSLFQTLAFWKQFLTWTRADEAWPQRHSPNEDTTLDPRMLSYQVSLADDITSSDLPMSAISPDAASDGLDVHQSWADQELLYNTVTKHHPALIHFTGPKSFRTWWWQRTWFHRHAQQLRLASLESEERARHDTDRPVIGGHQWYNFETPEAHEIRLSGLGGAWSDASGGWFSWRGLCQEFEAEFYEEEHDNFRHPPSEQP